MRREGQRGRGRKKGKEEGAKGGKEREREGGAPKAGAWGTPVRPMHCLMHHGPMVSRFCFINIYDDLGPPTLYLLVYLV
jgi:hypothetical protein